MADSIVSSSKITAVANAIRAKAGTQSTMTLDEMPTAIANIPGGGGGTIDLTGYDGGNWLSAVAPNVDTSGMTNMTQMFRYCLATSLDLSNFNTSNVTTFEAMFEQCTQLTSLDITHFDTSKATSMYRMFQNCRELTSLNFTSFNTSKVTSFNSTFSSCYKLVTLDNLSKFNTADAIDMNQMFEQLGSQASTPISLDLSHFRTSKVGYMFRMFNGANLHSLDLDNWDTSNVTTMGEMFRNSFKSGGKMWAPSTFVATGVTNTSNKPFVSAPTGQVDVYTDATDATTQGWGTIHANFVIHYNSTHQDFLNA